MNSFSSRTVMNANDLFDGNLINTKALYLQCFHTLPSVNYICNVDGEQAFEVFRKQYARFIKSIHRYTWFERKKKAYQFDKTVIILSNKTIVEFDDDYCEILHAGNDHDFVQAITNIAYSFKERQRRQPREINLIVQDKNRLGLKGLEIKRTKLNLDLFYEDDFRATDEVIQKRLCKRNDKGIVLLHGLPGTGKTTYLRYLVGRIKKRVLFLPPSVAENLVNPDFIDLLIDNPNSVLIIEDAEHIITDRKLARSQGVSNLLNISDGLLADALNVQLVCTFNSPLTMVDSALMRKGRLIAKYEFGKLGIEKAQRLSQHLGFDTEITRPMTVAEIAKQHEPEAIMNRVEVIGFRRQETLMN